MAFAHIFSILFVNLMCRATAQLRSIGSFPVSDAAFLTLYKNSSASNSLEQWNLVVTSFDAIPFTSDYVYAVQGIGKRLQSLNTTKPVVISSKVTWPNEPSEVPEMVFQKSMLAVPQGFLLPFKTQGSIQLFDLSAWPSVQGPYTITDVKSESETWFYHRVVWKDMDRDGRLDALTCRARKPIIGSEAGELLWYEHPADSNFNVPWKEHVIAKGPDVYFTNVSLMAGNSAFDCIIVAGFFSKCLEIYWTTDPEGKWTDDSLVKSRVIDSSVGMLFDVNIADINGDGKRDLLVTNNDAHNGSVFVYEIPADFRSGQFVRWTLASGFKPGSSGQGKGAPGSAEPFYPKIQNKTGDSGMKPFIFLSGDDDGHAYYLSPKSPDPKNWNYTLHTILNDGKATVGEGVIQDVDGDGYSEIFVPSYTKGLVSVFTFAP